jgi:hypothetical protein
MIVVRIELWPKGDATKAEHLGTARIVNDGTGTPDLGHYAVELSKWRSDKPWKSGRLENFPRKQFGPWDLLGMAILSVLSRERLERLGKVSEALAKEGTVHER